MPFTPSRRAPSRLLLAALVVLGTCALTGVSSAGTPPVPETQITNPPQPPVQGDESGTASPFPCEMDGALNDGRPYASGRKTLRAVMLFVDFPDAPATGRVTPKALYDGYMPKADATLRTVSRGRFGLSVTPHLAWVRMPKNSDQWGWDATLRQTTYQNHHDFIEAAVKAADPAVDFSGHTAVYVVATPSAPMPTAADQAEPRGSEFVADGQKMRHAVTMASGGDYFRSPIVLAHETIHLVGVGDLYPYDAKVQDRIGHWGYVGPWDMMSRIEGPYAPMTGWTRLLAGWADKKDFKCLMRDATVTLPSVDRPGRPKGLVFRTSRGSAYVVEARTDTVGDGCRRDGVLIYRAYSEKGSGEGPVRVVSAEDGPPRCGPHTDATFVPAPGRSSYRSPDGRLRVKVLGSSDKGVRVRVKVPTAKCRVPRLRGAPLAAARQQLLSSYCKLGKVKRPERGGDLVVVAQSSKPGKKLRAGSRIGVRLGRDGR